MISAQIEGRDSEVCGQESVRNTNGHPWDKRQRYWQSTAVYANFPTRSRKVAPS